MAKEDKKKKGGGKKSIVAIVGGILAIVMIIVLLASFIFAIFDAIIKFILGVVSDLITGFLNFLAHPIKSTIKALGALGDFLTATFNQEFDATLLEAVSEAQLIEISQKEFQGMRDAIDESISRDAAGLDDLMLKKILLTYNTGKYSKSTDIIIELGSIKGGGIDYNNDGYVSWTERNYIDYDGDGVITQEEKDIFKENKELVQKCDEDPSLCSPFTLIQGKKLEQLEMNYLDEASSHVAQFFETDDAKEAAIEAERNEKKEKQEKYYLYAKGVLTFVGDVVQNDGTIKEEELVYYNEEALNELYNKYYENKDWEKRDYAESVWNYLSSKAYTDGDKGIQMYAHEVINEEVIDWTFNDTDLYTPKINKQIIANYSKSRTLQDLDYYSMVSKYATPVEFMIDLLNISSSKEFVNAFIDKVTNQTSIKLKIYKTRLSSGNEITEDIEETTTVKGEVKITAKVTHVEKDQDGDIFYEEGDAGISVKVSLESGSAIGIGYTKVKLKLRNVPSKIRAVKIEVKIAERDNPETPVEIVRIGSDIPDGETKEITYLLDRYKTKSNTGTINRVTTELTTETKLDIAIEKAETWYATMTYDNYVQDNTVWESIDSRGQRVRVYSSNPIMVSKSKPDDVLTSTYSGWSEVIHTAGKSVESISISEIAGRVENWYANLTSDNLFYWGLGGPLTHNIYEWLDGDRGRSLATENELYNIRFIYAMEEGIGDAFTKSTYTPVEVRYKATSYKIGHLYTNVNNQLIQDTTPTVVSNYGFFLSLLKNNTGSYSKDASYNPNGKEVVYKTVYDSEDRVGRFFETSAEMLFNLLDSSPYTEGLTSVMRYIMYEYTTRNYGVTNFTYDIIPKEEFEWV